MKIMLPTMSIDFSQTTWSTKRLQSQNFIGKDGMWSFSSNGSSNTCTSNPSMEHLRMLSISRFGLPFVHTFIGSNQKEDAHESILYTQFQRTLGCSLRIKPQLMNYLTRLFPRKSQPITICRAYSDQKISKRDSSERF